MTRRPFLASPLLLLLLLLLLLPALAACDPMADTVRIDPYEPTPGWAVPGGSMPPPPRSLALDPARPGQPYPVDWGPVMKGADGYHVFCAPCHGPAAGGDGPAALVLTKAPPGLLAPDQRALSDAHLLRVITKGHGVMYGYAARIAPQDRRHIVAFLRSLQAAAAPAGPS